MSGMDMDKALINEFLVESYENLDQLDQDFVALERDPANRETLSSVFRTIHTIKGTCGFFGYEKLGSITHVGENLLSRLREGELELTPEITSALLAMVDAVREMLTSIESTSGEGDADYSALVETLSLLHEGKKAMKATKAKNAPAKDGKKLKTRQATEEASSPAPPEAIEAFESPSPTPPTIAQEPSVKEEAPPSQEESVAVDPGAPSVSESTIRVDVGLLDELMNLVGELVLARNQVLQFTSKQEDRAFIGTSQRLDLITTELQEGIMKTRMQPIGNVWNKFPRVVRDLATAHGKKVRIEMEGKETELDKTIIEAIKDPLTHLVRNAVDHGIETPKERVARGKPEEGLLILRAFHEGGQVNIEISEDGAGIDPEKIKQKALEKGLIARDQAAHMGDREAVNLVFMPGLSTAERVTKISGRGVGMDVVKTNIEKIGGTVDIQSRLGEGTTFKIKIPLTLAIIPALIVNSGGDRYAIPQVSLLELVRLEGGQASGGIEMIHGAPVYRLRGSLLPLVHLNRELEIEDELVGPASNGEGEVSEAEEAVVGAASNGQGAVINIVVLQADERQFGLIVDGIHDTEEIVVKPLGKQIKGLSAFAGATIMGDGRVALILDALGLAQRAGVVSEVRDRTLVDQAARIQEDQSERQAMLVFSMGDGHRLAMPLSMVARLEKFPRSAIERAGNQEAVQYRNQIMPLIRLSGFVGVSGPEPSAADEHINVVVYSENGQDVGLVVDSILDIVEETVTVMNTKASSNGILGSAVIQGQVTDLLDVERIVNGGESTSIEEWLEAAGTRGEQ